MNTASNSRSSFRVTIIRSAPSTTWLFVSMCPSSSMTSPVPTPPAGTGWLNWSSCTDSVCMCTTDRLIISTISGIEGVGVGIGAEEFGSVSPHAPRSIVRVPIMRILPTRISFMRAPFLGTGETHGEWPSVDFVAEDILSQNSPYQCLGASKERSSTRAMVAALRNAVIHTIKLTRTICRRRELAFDWQRMWLSLRLHSLRTPLGTHLALGYLSSRLTSPRIFAAVVPDGARRYAEAYIGLHALRPWLAS